MFVGGVCTTGEAASATVRRELCEELGLDVAADPVLRCECAIATDLNQCVVSVFEATISEAEAEGITFADGEVQGGGWMGIPQVATLARSSVVTEAASAPTTSACGGVLEVLEEALGAAGPGLGPGQQNAVVVPDGLAVWFALLASEAASDSDSEWREG